MTWSQVYLIDAAAILLFAVSYYRNCYRKGYRIDFWHAQLLLSCVFPYLFMFFFTKNELNAVIVGSDFRGIVDIAPHVFLIIFVGYLCIFAGAGFWSLGAGVGARRMVARVLSVAPRCSIMLMSSRDLLLTLSVIFLFFQSILLSFYFQQNGFGIDLRAYTFAHPEARPFAQITALSSVWIGTHCLARYVDTKEKTLLACTLLLAFGLVFFGQRGNIFGIFINVALCHLVKLRSRISLARIVGTVAGLLSILLYLGNARAGVYSVAEFFGSLFFLLLYGNNFTDFRDFAWMYSDWNHQLWVGKTYLAGLATFVPRGASDFRATWSFGIATGWTVGLDTEFHPGLKPGIFGEAFFNFGLLGVVLIGLVFGLILRRVDLDVKSAMSSISPSMRTAFASTILLSLSASVTGSLNLPSFYALCGIYLFSWFYLRARALIFPSRILSAGGT